MAGIVGSFALLALVATGPGATSTTSPAASGADLRIVAAAAYVPPAAYGQSSGGWFEVVNLGPGDLTSSWSITITISQPGIAVEGCGSVQPVRLTAGIRCDFQGLRVGGAPFRVGFGLMAAASTPPVEVRLGSIRRFRTQTRLTTPPP